MTSIKEMERVYSFSQGARMGNCSKEGTGEGKWELVGQSFQHDFAYKKTPFNVVHSPFTGTDAATRKVTYN